MGFFSKSFLIFFKLSSWFESLVLFGKLFSIRGRFGKLVYWFWDVESSFLRTSIVTIWRRNRQPTPVLLPGKFHRLRSLVGYSPWGRKESDRTEWLHFTCPNNYCKKQDICMEKSSVESSMQAKVYFCHDSWNNNWTFETKNKLHTLWCPI